MLRLKGKNAALVVDRTAVCDTDALRPVERHDGSDRAVDLFRGFFFIWLDVSGRVGTDEDVVHHPAKSQTPAVGDFAVH